MTEYAVIMQDSVRFMHQIPVIWPERSGAEDGQSRTGNLLGASPAPATDQHQVQPRGGGTLGKTGGTESWLGPPPAAHGYSEYFAVPIPQTQGTKNFAVQG